MGNNVFESSLPFQCSNSNFIVLGQMRTVSSVISFLPVPPVVQALKWLLKNITAHWNHKMIKHIKLLRAICTSWTAHTAHKGISPFCCPVSPFSHVSRPGRCHINLFQAPACPWVLPWPLGLASTGNAGPEEGQWGWKFHCYLKGALDPKGFMAQSRSFSSALAPRMLELTASIDPMDTSGGIRAT